MGLVICPQFLHYYMNHLFFYQGISSVFYFCASGLTIIRIQQQLDVINIICLGPFTQLRVLLRVLYIQHTLY